ncbi:adenine-specific DNA-methyltransferase, partial (plasmid) [Klebsiella pneumoniae]
MIPRDPRSPAPDLSGHCCKVSDEAAFCLIQRPYISKTLLTRRISPRG